MKSVLINPYLTVVIDISSFDRHRAWIPPLGLGYIKSYTNQNSRHEVTILDCVGQSSGKITRFGNTWRIGLTDDELVERLRASSPDVVGVSACFTPNYEDSLNIAKLVKRVLPNSTVVMGGHHATIDYMNVIKAGPIDVVVRGDGEETFLELLNNMESGDWKRTKGTVCIDGANVITNEMRQPIQDLDSLPFPSYEGVNIDYYLHYDEKDAIKRFLYEPVGSIMSSRGCYYNCIFCATDSAFKRFRGRSPANVVDEMEYLIKKYRVKEIVFHDDCFLSSKERVKGICEEMLRRGIKIRWQAGPGMSVWLLDEELLTLMHRTGLYRAALTLESGSEETLKFIRKKVNLEKAKDIIRICNRLGIRVSANFIIGFPHETMKNIDETRRYILGTDLDSVAVLLSQPLKGAELFHVYEKEGLMPDTGPLLGSSIFRTRYGNKHFTANELNAMAEKIRREFNAGLTKKLMTPAGFYYHVITKLNSFSKIKYTIKKYLCRFFG